MGRARVVERKSGVRAVEKAACRAFSMVELLAVMTVVAVLVSILLPSVGASRRVAQGQVCGSNLRQLGNGFVYYSGDFKDRIPPVGTPYNFEWDNTRHVSNRGASFHHYLGKQGYFGTSQVVSDMGVTNTRFAVTQCPGESGSLTDATMAGQTYFNWVRSCTSYSMNWSVSRYAYYVGYNGLTDVFRVGWQRGSPLIKPWDASVVYDCPEMGSSWAMPYSDWYQDSVGSAYFDQSGSMFGTYNYAFRHMNQTRNALFMDGHVTGQKHRSATNVALYQALWTVNPPGIQ
jgi:prepilin-type N-terminal cleavage/methylation domain-containing protein/prepilin-type processing-associated H-X9-DG protein